MSPLIITALIVSGIVVLFLIGYINHMVESKKLKQVRLKADLNDRVRRSRDVSEHLPSQLMSPELKLLLSRFELHYSEKLLAQDSRNSNLRSCIAELREQVAKGNSISVTNPSQKIANEAKAKDIRFLLENFHGLITRAVQDRLLPVKEGKRWQGEIRHMLTQLHCELFSNLGQQAMQQGQPSQARLAYERGTQYLRKQPNGERYKAQLQQFEQLLAQANAVLLEKTSPNHGVPNELADGSMSLEEDNWKKKNLYD